MEVMIGGADSREWSTKGVVTPVIFVPTAVEPVELFVEARVPNVKLVGTDSYDGAYQVGLACCVRSFLIDIPYLSCSSAIFQVYRPPCTTS